MKSLNEENYLKAIFHLIDKDDTFTVNELSKMLNIKMPSVNSMMKKFSQKNWVSDGRSFTKSRNSWNTSIQRFSLIKWMNF